MSHHPLPDLRTLGYRRTPQRRLVWDVLHQQGPFLTAEEIYHKAKKQFPDFSLTTVYRNLASLRDMGLVHEIRAGKGPCRYVTAVDYNGAHQFVCDRCGAVVEIDDLLLRQRVQQLAEANGFAGDCVTDVVVYSRCTACVGVAREQTELALLRLRESS